MDLTFRRRKFFIICRMTSMTFIFRRFSLCLLVNFHLHYGFLFFNTLPHKREKNGVDITPRHNSPRKDRQLIETFSWNCLLIFIYEFLWLRNIVYMNGRVCKLSCLGIVVSRNLAFISSVPKKCCIYELSCL